MSIVKSIKTYLSTKIHPTIYLPPELITLLTVQAVFLIGIGLSNTFVNIFLWQAEKSLTSVAIYNAANFATTPLFFLLGGWIAKKVSLTFNLRVGIILHGIFYILLLVLKSDAVDYVLFLGILMGISGGFYYLAYNVLIYDFSNNENRDYIMGVQGLVISAAAMLAPFVAGVIINAQTGLRGYLIIFSSTLILFVISAALSTKIPTTISQKKYYIKSLLFMPFRNRNWRLIMTGETLRGFREGVMAFLTSILLYSIVNKELAIGYYTLVCSAVQLISFYYTSQKIKPYNRKRYLLLGSLGIAVISSLFLFRVNIVTVYLYGIFSSFFITFINSPSSGIIYWVIHKTPNSKKRRIEGIAVREVFLNFGRVAGVVLLIMMRQDLKTISWIVFFLGVTQIAMWFFFNKAQIE